MTATSRKRRLRRRALLQCLLLGVLASTVQAQSAEPYREDTVKAAFLYRFPGYMEWPRQTLRSQDHFTIAVLNAKTVADELSRLLKDRPINNLPARVKVVESARQASDAQILYVGPDYAGNLGAVIESLDAKPVLIVTDHARGLTAGSAVNFMLVDRRVRFEVSLMAAERAGIKVSSQLLAVATRVRGTRLRMDTPCRPLLTTPALEQKCTVRVAHL